MDRGFDYEILARCQYGVADFYYSGGEMGVADCGEPAIYKVWWADNMSDAMLVCQKHFEFIKKTEIQPE